MSLLGLVLVVVIGLVVLGRETQRLATTSRPAVFELDEAVGYIADLLPAEVQARISHDDVRWVLLTDADLLEQASLEDPTDAIATTDDRAATQATLESLGVAQLVDALACGDDGHAIKPAPDAVLKLCAQFGLTPANAIVIGDTTADLRMARAAGARLAVGVLSGVGTRAVLAPLADVLLPSVGELLTN